MLFNYLLHFCFYSVRPGGSLIPADKEEKLCLYYHKNGASKTLYRIDIPFYGNRQYVVNVGKQSE